MKLDGLTRGAVTLAVVSLLLYLLVASSPQYGHYAPVPLASPWLYSGYMVGGFLLSIIIASWWALAAIALLPPLIFALARVVLPSQLGVVATLGMGLHPFITWSLQGLVIQLFFSFTLVGVGAVIGVWLREILS